MGPRQPQCPRPRSKGRRLPDRRRCKNCGTRDPEAWKPKKIAVALRRRRAQGSPGTSALFVPGPSLRPAPMGLRYGCSRPCLQTGGVGVPLGGHLARPSPGRTPPSPPPVPIDGRVAGAGGRWLELNSRVRPGPRRTHAGGAPKVRTSFFSAALGRAPRETTFAPAAARRARSVRTTTCPAEGEECSLLSACAPAANKSSGQLLTSTRGRVRL